MKKPRESREIESETGSKGMAALYGIPVPQALCTGKRSMRTYSAMRGIACPDNEEWNGSTRIVDHRTWKPHSHGDDKLSSESA